MVVPLDERYHAISYREVGVRGYKSMKRLTRYPHTHESHCAYSSQYTPTQLPPSLACCVPYSYCGSGSCFGSCSRKILLSSAQVIRIVSHCYDLPRQRMYVFSLDRFVLRMMTRLLCRSPEPIDYPDPAHSSFGCSCIPYFLLRHVYHACACYHHLYLHICRQIAGFLPPIRHFAGTI